MSRNEKGVLTFSYYTYRTTLLRTEENLGSLARPSRREYSDSMRRIGATSFFSSSRWTGLAFPVIFLCICVLSQMLGTPVTLIGLLTSSISVESVAEDFSIPPITPEPELASHSNFDEKREPVLHLPVFVTSVFHPPQA